MDFDMSAVGDILVCPACHCEMVLEGDGLVDVSPDCRCSYQILNGIPRLLISESTELDREEWGAIMARHGRNSTTGQLASKDNGSDTIASREE